MQTLWQSEKCGEGTTAEVVQKLDALCPVSTCVSPSHIHHAIVETETMRDSKIAAEALSQSGYADDDDRALKAEVGTPLKSMPYSVPLRDQQ